MVKNDSLNELIVTVEGFVLAGLRGMGRERWVGMEEGRLIRGRIEGLGK